MNVFEKGQYVDIVGGNYKRRTGIVVKQCKIKVRVLLLDSNGDATSEVCLMPHNVSFRRSSISADDSRSSTIQITYAKSNIRRTFAVQRPNHHLHGPEQEQEQQEQEQHRPPYGCNGERFFVGQPVNIVGSTYKGRMGLVTKLCAVKIKVKLDGDAHDVCLFRSSVRGTDDATLTTSSVVDSVAIVPRTQSNLPHEDRISQVMSATPFSVAILPVVMVQEEEPVTPRRRSMLDHDPVSPSLHYQRQRTPSRSYNRDLTHIRVSPSTHSDDLYFDAEDEEFFDAHQQPREVEDVYLTNLLQFEQRDAHLTVDASTPIPSDEATATRQISAVVSDDDASTAATSFMSAEDYDDEENLDNIEHAESRSLLPPPSIHVFFTKEYECMYYGKTRNTTRLIGPSLIAPGTATHQWYMGQFIDISYNNQREVAVAAVLNLFLSTQGVADSMNVPDIIGVSCSILRCSSSADHCCVDGLTEISNSQERICQF